MKHANHILRAVGVLVLGAAGFFTIRSFLVPESFGVHDSYTYGYYRGTSDAEQEALPVLYQGSDACFSCHAEATAGWKAGLHSGVPCANCHGICLNGKDETGGRPLTDTTTQGCLRCHAIVYGRPAGFPQVADLDVHVQEVAAWGCQVGAMVQVDNTRNVAEKGDVFAQGLRCVFCHNAHHPLLNLEKYVEKKQIAERQKAQASDNQTGMKKEVSW